VFNLLSDNGSFHPHQSGFLPGHSTTTQLLDIYHNLCAAADERKDTSMIFCDISKAFDRVWHEGLLFKLRAVGIEGNVLRWFKSYLTGRKQRVVLGGIYSSWKEVNAGVPQGSVLGPLMFLIYINDISVDLSSNIRLYADDTILFFSGEDEAEYFAPLQNDLISIDAWSDKWIVGFNPKKTENLLVSRRRNIIQQHFYFKGDAIPIVQHHKHLGLFLSFDLSWNYHIQNILKTANQRIGILLSLKYKFSRRVLETLYVAYVRSVLEYGDVVYDNCFDYLKIQLEDLQIKALRCITGLTRSCSRHLIYIESGFVPLEERRRRHKLIMFYKIVNQMAPTYLTDILPRTVEHRNPYGVRGRGNITSILCRTQTYAKSFFPSTVLLWNGLEHVVRESPSINSFKRALSEADRQVPQWYYYGDRQCQIIHSQLRNKCSSLKDDLYKNHVIENPKCFCGFVRETREHFISHCPQYREDRIELREKLARKDLDLNVNVLLFGTDEYSAEINFFIVSAFHNFLKKSGRFQI
jgi:hypothetical protein